MLKKLTLVALIAFAGATIYAQEKTVTVADFAGTWNIEVLSHQVALVIEPQERNKVTGTMMMMGRDVPAGTQAWRRGSRAARRLPRKRARDRAPHPGSRETQRQRRHAASPIHSPITSS